MVFYESSYNICLAVTKSSANHYQQYSRKQHSGCNFHVSFGQHHGSGLLQKQLLRWKEMEEEKKGKIPAVIY